MPRKIAMIGTAASNQHAPYANESWEIWGVSRRGKAVTRATRWFEIHRLAGEPEAWANNWRQTVKKELQGVPLYMFYPEPELGDVRIYPAQQITARFGTFFLTSTFAWMVALAIEEIAPKGQMAPPGSEISIFGVDMEYGTEYVQQRAGLRHFMRLADALGFQVTFLASGGMAYEPIAYPFWQDDPMQAKLNQRQQEVKEVLELAEEDLRNTREMLCSVQGQLAEAKRAGEPGYDAAARIAVLEGQSQQLNTTSAVTSKRLVAAETTLKTQSWLADYLAP